MCMLAEEVGLEVERLRVIPGSYGGGCEGDGRFVIKVDGAVSYECLKLNLKSVVCPAFTVTPHNKSEIHLKLTVTGLYFVCGLMECDR